LFISFTRHTYVLSLYQVRQFSILIYPFGLGYLFCCSFDAGPDLKKLLFIGTVEYFSRVSCILAVLLVLV